MPMVDVRDVANAHIQTALDPKHGHRNERWLMATESLFYSELTQLIYDRQKEIVGETGHRIKKSRKVGFLTLQIGSLIFRGVGSILPFLDRKIVIDGAPALKEFGVQGTIQDSLVEMAREIWKFENRKH